MSRSRSELLDRLTGQPEPTTLSALVEVSGLHPNTLREHLSALEKAGLVRRFRAQPHGRGRPAWLYEATEHSDDGGGAEYAGLAATLAAAIHRTSSAPAEDAVAAGTQWGHDLARSKGAPGEAGDPAARRQVIALLADFGFGPEPDERDEVVRLTRCPLLEAAHRYPDVVCGVHLGLVRGALEEYGVDPAGTDLLPFSEPGACRLDLVTRPTKDQ